MEPYNYLPLPVSESAPMPLDVLELMRPMIQLARIKIQEVTEDAYEITHAGTPYTVQKGHENCFYGSDNSHGSMLGLSLELRRPEGIYIDENVPSEFGEVVMFHEIREQEYAKMKVEDAHNRALHDELLYIVKFFSPKKQREYLEWAEDYRANTNQHCFASLEDYCIEGDFDKLESLLDDQISALEVVSLDGALLEFAPPHIRDDREVVLEAVSNYGRALEFASPRLQDDLGVVFFAVEQDWTALEFASESRKKDSFIIDAAVKQDRRAYDLLPDELFGEEGEEDLN